MKRTPLILVRLVLGLALVFLYSYCEDDDPPPPPPDPCTARKATPSQDQYIVYFPDSIRTYIDSKEPNEYAYTNKIIDYLRDTAGHFVEKRCMCRNIFLMNVNQDTIDPQERVLDAEGEIGSTGEETGNPITERNHRIQIVPFVGQDPRAVDKPLNRIDRDLNDQIPGVTVAITDTGFDPDVDPTPGITPNLVDYVWLNEVEWFQPGPDPDENCIIDDLNGANVAIPLGMFPITDSHGTSVAGKAAGLPKSDTDQHNENGGYPDDEVQLELINLNFFDQNAATLFDGVCAMRYAIEKQSDVITASWGLYKDIGGDVLLREVLDLARDSNVTIVAAAGNDTVNIDSCHFLPASYAAVPGFDHVITVGAFDVGADALADFSNFGNASVQIMANGVDVEALTTPAGIVPVSGTSIAAPDVTRTVSILKAMDPNLPPPNLRNVLISNSQRVGSFPEIGGGILDHCATVATVGINCN